MMLQVQRCGEAEDLPDAESIRAYACTLPDALPLLQSELQPVCGRIGQASPAVQLAHCCTLCLVKSVNLSKGAQVLYGRASEAVRSCSILIDLHISIYRSNQDAQCMLNDT